MEDIKRVLWVKQLKTTKNTRCWICGRGRRELEKAVKEYWQGEKLGKNLYIELMKNDLYLDACFETIAIRKRGSRQKMQIPVCIICSLLIRQCVLECLKRNLEVVVKTKQLDASINFNPF
jgi:hypothetical protein